MAPPGQQQKVYDETGALVSTDDGYGDPNGRLADFGGQKYALTGDSQGWRHDYVDLSAFAGETSTCGCARPPTPPTSTAAGSPTTSPSPAVRTRSGATTSSPATTAGPPRSPRSVGTTGPGWRIDSGTSQSAQYYLVEWRNFDGFDEGLKYAYDTVYSDGAWKVDKIRYNAPGALIWYRDTSYGNANHVANNATNLPSGGAKGGLLIVDSHFDPLRRTGEAADFDPTVLNNMPSRPQSSNAAFGLQKTYPFTECMADAATTRSTAPTSRPSPR